MIHATRFMLTIAALLLAGCAVQTAGLGNETGPDSVPKGSALLDSDETGCDGIVRVADTSVANRGNRDDYYIDPGENATYRLERGPVEWTCVGRETHDYGRHACPRGASHVRFTRAAEGDDLLLECFG